MHPVNGAFASVILVVAASCVGVQAMGSVQVVATMVAVEAITAVATVAKVKAVLL